MEAVVEGWRVAEAMAGVMKKAAMVAEATVAEAMVGAKAAARASKLGVVVMEVAARATVVVVMEVAVMEVAARATVVVVMEVAAMAVAREAAREETRLPSTSRRGSGLHWWRQQCSYTNLWVYLGCCRRSFPT